MSAAEGATRERAETLSRSVSAAGGAGEHRERLLQVEDTLRELIIQRPGTLLVWRERAARALAAESRTCTLWRTRIDTLRIAAHERADTFSLISQREEERNTAHGFRSGIYKAAVSFAALSALIYIIWRRRRDD